jgi:8-oxo-dGTP pyrophosphatase MutT (NUDIX family)
LEHQGRFLLGKRSAHRPVAPGYWCPISGGVEPGETQAEAVVREVREEVGLRVRALRKFAQCDTHDGTTVLHWWFVEILDGALEAQLANDENSELRWLTPTELQVIQPSFAEDIAILQRAAAALRGDAPGDQRR